MTHIMGAHRGDGRAVSGQGHRSRDSGYDLTPAPASHDWLPHQLQILAFRSRKALPITDTELKLMAAAASIGLSSRPMKG